MLGAHVIKVASERNCKLEVTGTDISPEMLTEAGKKGVYKSLILADLNEGVHDALDNSGIGQKQFDFVVASGLFLPGHCGPDAFNVLLKALKKNGKAVVTVRQAAYETEKQKWRKAEEEAGAKMISDEIHPYYGNIEAVVLVVEKSEYD